MKIKTLTISNFRGLKYVELTKCDQAKTIVIAGPNAVGKSTILEALRLLRVTLAQTYLGEMQEAYGQMGIAMQNLNNIDFNAVCRDPSKPTEIKCELLLSDPEISILENAITYWAKIRIANQLGVLTDEINTRLTALFSTPDGNKRFEDEIEKIKNEIANIRATKIIYPHLIIDPIKKHISGIKSVDHEAFQILSRQDGSYFAIFNYFHADRAMQIGDSNIQIGPQDVQQQLKSHLAVPALKYQRLKNYLVSRTLLGREESEQIKSDFLEVVDGLLTKKTLDKIHLLRNGRLRINIFDDYANKHFDIDSMSSGEKNILLTMFLIKRTTAPNGIILLDEPELHLNASVCREILPFLIEKILTPNDFQAILCTHSEQILAVAHERTDTHLYHLRSEDDLSKIETHDSEEVENALKALGTDHTGILFSKGVLYVEGVDDEEFLRVAFRDHIKNFLIKPMIGRGEIENQIKVLQTAEKKGDLSSIHTFIFDLDRKPTELSSSKNVRLAQWNKYCFENYLLDSESVYYTIKELGYDDTKNELYKGKLEELMKEYAFKQIPRNVVYETFKQHRPPVNTPKLDNIDVDYPNIGNIFADSIDSTCDYFKNYSRDEWIQSFSEKCLDLDTVMKDDWSLNWRNKASGKVIIENIKHHFGVKANSDKFKIELIKQGLKRNSDLLAGARTIITDLIK